MSGTLKHDAGVFSAGTRYSAHDPELLRWVHATLVDSIPLAYECFVGPLTPEEKDRYCLEAVEMEAHLGMPQGLLPRSRLELDRYLQRMGAGDEIQVTSTARTLAQNLLSPRLGPAGFLFAPARLIAIGLLPPRIREGCGFPWRERDEAALERWRARSVACAHGFRGSSASGPELVRCTAESTTGPLCRNGQKTTPRALGRWCEFC